MTPQEFIRKWEAGGDERRDAQPFFEDLCRLVGHPTPREADPEHTWFTYERGASKTSGGEGWADVWKKGYFGWEAKGTHKSLEKAYEQLKMYADALENPPLLVVSDLRTIVVHTNFTNTVKREISFTIEQLNDFETRQILEAVFKNPDSLRPAVTRAYLTTEAAEKFSTLAQNLRDQGHNPHRVAHFLNKLLFAMFAEDIGLLPNELFTKLVRSSQGRPDAFEKRCSELFAAMTSGGDVAFENIEWFNGGLFDDAETLRLEDEDLKTLLSACVLDWSSIEPAIFGTLFERGLDPSKRAQTGTHYTDPDTIMKIVRPVIVEPWLREWEAEKKALAMMTGKSKRRVSKAAEERATRYAEARGFSLEEAAAFRQQLMSKSNVSEAATKRFVRFLEKLRAFTVLDPACGSGNFLYLSLRALKDVEKRVIIEGEAMGLGRQIPGVGPRNVKGIEINDYAAELARITIWIGEIQWMIQNGYGARRNPILQPLDQIENRDALLDRNGGRAAWSPADVIVGNPPFLGNKKILGKLGDDYTKTLRRAYARRVPNGADFVCYWFAKATDAMRTGLVTRVGLVATQSIRAGSSRTVLEDIVEHGRIYNAWSDERWINEGAAVRVSLICYASNGAVGNSTLDGRVVSDIAANLAERGDYDVSRSKSLSSNIGVAFQGVIPRGEVNPKSKLQLCLPDASFVIDGETARGFLKGPSTPNGHPIREVIFPYWIADDLTGRPMDRFIVNFGERTEAEAAMFEAPFAAIGNVKLHRERMEDGKDKRNWWQLARSRPAMYRKMDGFSRYIATPRVAKHRLFVLMDRTVVPDSRLYAIVRDDFATLGILHSRIHEVWSLATSSRHGVGNDPTYNAESCFETFPFPEGLTPNIPATEYADDPRAVRIAEAARGLVEARDRWLNPPEWTHRVPEVVPGYPERIVANPEHETELKKRTLTNLYNTRPTWLDNLHRDLDTAVAAAYGWEWPLSDDEILRRLFGLNQT